MLSNIQESRVVIRYRPHAKQELFHRDRYNVKFRLLSGGTGSGKTIAGVWEMLSYLIDDNPGAVGFVFEPTIPMVKRNLIKGAFERLLGSPLQSNPIVKDYIKTDNCIDFVNGSRLWFGSLDDPESAEGPNIDFIHVDEARLVRHFDVAWRVIQRRIRGSKLDKYPTGAYITTTPNAPNSFMHSFFENPKTRHPNSKVYRMSLFDNPYLTEEYIENIQLAHTTKGLEDRFVYGKFAGVGAVTMPFDSTVHVLETIDHTLLRKICAGVDFGWTNPSAIIVIGFDGDDRVYVLDEFYQPRVHDETFIAECQRLRDKYKIERFYCDRSEPKSIENLRRNGLTAYADKSKREDGIHSLARRFKKAGDDKPRIFIHSKCVNLIDELQSYNEEVKEFDHAVDALRYGVINTHQGEMQVGRARIPW